MRSLHLRQRRIRSLQIQQFAACSMLDVLLEEIIHHRHRRRAAAREALNELNGVLSIGRNRDWIAMARVMNAMRVSVFDLGMRMLLVTVLDAVVFAFPLLDIDPRLLRDRVAELVGTRHLAGKRTADANVARPGRDTAEHRVKGDQLEDMNRLKLELLPRST